MEQTNRCPVETTLSLIGGKYKVLILWNLSQGPLRFTELHKRIPSATPKMLTQQLRELETATIISRKVYPTIPPKVEYALTELGYSLMPVLISIRDWGVHFLSNQNLESSCFMVNHDPCEDFPTDFRKEE